MVRKPITAKRICRNCLRLLGPLDGPALDHRCLVCRLGGVLSIGEIAVLAIEDDGRISAVQYVHSTQTAERLAYAWKRSRLEVIVVEPLASIERKLNVQATAQ